mmetsp:Transcript_145997/g.468147  ORF Transcript_145997/g.468147 Transcript_145997/m.468147 type:complete len:258 (-) Transcript_145997:2725-3498(-)
MGWRTSAGCEGGGGPGSSQSERHCGTRQRPRSPGSKTFHIQGYLAFIPVQAAGCTVHRRPNGVAVCHSRCHPAVSCRDRISEVIRLIGVLRSRRSYGSMAHRASCHHMGGRVRNGRAVRAALLRPREVLARRLRGAAAGGVLQQPRLQTSATERPRERGCECERQRGRRGSTPVVLHRRLDVLARLEPEAAAALALPLGDGTGGRDVPEQPREHATRPPEEARGRRGRGRSPVVVRIGVGAGVSWSFGGSGSNPSEV